MGEEDCSTFGGMAAVGRLLLEPLVVVVVVVVVVVEIGSSE
jgi:hypothetical protein